MARSFNKIACLVLIVLVASGMVFAQSLVARANQAQVGQKSIFTVIGSATPVCLNLAQFDFNGNLWTLGSYYVAPFATYQIAAPVIPFKTTSVFSFSSPLGVDPATACNGVPTASLTDPMLEPQLYQQLVGGSLPTITVAQLNAAVGIAAAFCNSNNSGTETASASAQGGSAIAVNGNLCLNFARNTTAQLINTNVNQVVVFGFEELTFNPIAGDPFAAALAACTTPIPNTTYAAGAEWSLVCRAIGGGTFGQTLP